MVVQRMRNELQAIYDKLLVKGESEIILSVPTTMEKQFLYRIREAMAAAEYLKFPKINKLKDITRVKIHSHMGDMTFVKITKVVLDALTLVLESPRDQFSLVEAITKHQDDANNYIYLFPNIDKDNREIMGDVLNYCESRGMVLEELDNGILIKRLA